MDGGPQQFKLLLREYRLSAGLTQEELAERAGLSWRGVQDLERGVRRRPQTDTARRLAEALGLSVEQRAGLLTAATRDERGREAAADLSKLPRRLTSFVGRAKEIVDLRQRIKTARMLTLVGPGGIGKTRLALQVADGLSAEFRDGICFVDLSAVGRPELVMVAIAHALGLRTELDREPERAVLTALAGRQLLIVLDNCEHLIHACADAVGGVLQAGAEVCVLSTSREPLGVQGEMLWRVGPLGVADGVRLFVDRAGAKRADFQDADQATIAAICRALDHLPLAIELAACRVSMLDPAEMLPRLEDRFALLQRNLGRGEPPRQRTLRATVDWSYDLLEPAEQRLFRRLAVFADGFSLDAAEAMGEPNGLDVLGRLVDKSLVVAQSSPSGTRYRLLETLRSYGWERLLETGEVEVARERHVHHFLSRAEALFTPTDSVDGRTRELDDSLEDLRRALEWCLERDPASGLRLVAATRDVWWRRSSSEGRRWAKAFLERCVEPGLARAQALQAAGFLEALGNPTRAMDMLLEARELAVTLDTTTTAMVDFSLGFAAFAAEDAPRAIVHLEQALATLDALGDVRGRANMSVFLGWTLLTDRVRREEARVRLEDAYHAGQQLEDSYVAGMAQSGLGLYWRWTGQPERALAHFRSAVVVLGDLEVGPSLAGALLHIARLLPGIDPERAARVAGGGLALADRMGVHLAPRLVRAMTSLQSELGPYIGEPDVRRMWIEGGRLTTREVIALALDEPHIRNNRKGHTHDH